MSGHIKNKEPCEYYIAKLRSKDKYTQFERSVNRDRYALHRNTLIYELYIKT